MRSCNEDESSKHGGTDPWEVFSQLVILVVEGRTPGGDRGYHAGPHCFRPQQPIGNRHECNLNSTTCLKADLLLKQLRLMWEVGVGVSVEVLLAPDCRHGVDIANTLDTTSAPLPMLKLLEQWNFTICDRRIPSATSSGWALVAAVRSYLHFSQLSAWLSSSGGSSPPNVLYRLTVTSPMFCSKFEGLPQVHSFPIATIGSETSMKVIVRSLPRTSKIPYIICDATHGSINSEINFGEPSKNLTHEWSDNEVSSSVMVDSSVKDQVHRTDEDLRRSMMKAKLTDAVLVRRSESPDTQLGESLLDPPNCMSRIPKRFQSPSRSGSPSLETPEHLLCKVRQSGPSHARPPGSVPFCQPLVIPARQPLNPFPWTRTCYPGFDTNPSQFNDNAYIPKPFNVAQDVKVFQDPLASASIFAPDFQSRFETSISNSFVRPTPQYAVPNVAKDPAVKFDEKRVNSAFGPQLHNRDGPIPGPSKHNWNYFKASKLPGYLEERKVDCENNPSVFNSSTNRPIKTMESLQGTKRKSIHKKESPNKRESPPHYSKQEEYGKSLYLLDDQLWPRCSLPGKHLCTSTEDISDICDKAAGAVDMMPKTSQIETCRSSVSKLFDLTPKETKEILDVLRQSTPVPPLRINRAEIDQDPAEYIYSQKSKLYHCPENTFPKIKGKNGNLKSTDKYNATLAQSPKTDLDVWEKEVYFRKPRIYNEPSTSANYSCDNSIKKSIDIPLPSCSTGVKRKLLNDLRDPVNNMKDCVTVTKCIQAKTIKEKTNSYTAVSHPARSPRHMSVILGKKSSSANHLCMKRSSPYVSDDEGESSKAKRSFSSKKDQDSETNSDNRESQKVITDNYEIQEKNESLLKRLMKPINLSLITSTDQINGQNSKTEGESLRTIYKRDETETEDKENTNDLEDFEVEDLCRSKGVAIPSTTDKVNFRRSFDSATSLVFHNKTGLPLTSSPAPMRKGNSFDYDSSLITVAAIKSALRSCDDENESLIKINSPSETVFKPVISLSAPATVTCSNLLGNFEESVLNGRLEPFSTVHGFRAEIAASGSFCPKHVSKPVTVFFYTLCDNYQMSSPYMGHVDLGKKGYQVPSKGTVQVTLFNPHGTVVKMFVVMYDLSDMPSNSKTFLRQRTLNMPVGETDNHSNAHQWLRYLIHLRFASSRSGKIYLHTDLRMMIFRKADVDAALLHQTDVPYEVRSFTHGPTNPRFSPRK